MIPDTPEQRYAELLRLSGLMLEAARQGQWDALVALELERADVVAACADPVPAAIAPRIAEMIAAILGADAQTLALARSWHDELRELLGSLEVERKLQARYGP